MPPVERQKINAREVIGINGGLMTNMARAILADFQLWQIQAGGGSIEEWRLFKNFAGQRCLDIHNDQYVNGAELVQWDCATDSNRSNTQQWYIDDE